ncbi:MAG: replication restart helicase PriA [Oscillochloridaceae bacterium umkhey_bin13]
MPTALIAEVALRASLGHDQSPVLSYLVPPRLRGLIQPGRLVWAPLRRRSVQGVVLRVITTSDPETKLRELDDLADPEASLTLVGLELAVWLATTYRAPLYEALALLLPPGVSQELAPTWRATAAGLQADLGTLPERERAVLYLLRLRGEQNEHSLRAALRGGDTELRATYDALVERGLATRGQYRSAPAVRPRMVRVARLAITTEELPATLEALARAPKQRAVLEWMAQHAAQTAADGTVPLSTIYAATGVNAQVIRILEQRGVLVLDQHEVRRDPLAGDGVPPDQPPPLTAGQRDAYNAIVTALEASAATAATSAATAPVFLLHGITGSGKTEVYLRTIARALRLGRQALVLVPEIALTAQLVRRFAARFPGQLAVLHSGLGLGERYDEWRRLRRGTARLAIGSRSAVFAPLPELGLVIVDEEHELSYKHDAAPRYHARDAALQLARLAGATVILGSATPSVESYARAQAGVYQLLRLPERVGGGLGVDGMPRSEPLPLPAVRLVDMRQELQAGHRSIFSRPLLHALEGTLSRGEQSILFLNRRGAAAFVMCRDCGHVVSCGNCSGPMTVHDDASDEEPTGSAGPARGVWSSLICHSCGARGTIPYVCTQCLSPRIKRFGVGTQRVAAEVVASFPGARVLRWDRDTASAKGAHGRMLDSLLRGEVDVLVGTQMIAKGLDLPMVALVGVVAADMGLHLPDFRSGERAFQLLTQVAGRAGRRTAGAHVIIQSYNPEHYALQAAQEHDYGRFFAEEIAFRQVTGYPPFSRLVRLLYAGSSEDVARREAEKLAERLTPLLAQPQRYGWSLIGPAPAFMQRARGRWRWHLIIRAPADLPPTALRILLDELGPLHGWMVDVDPMHVL